ncbi:MAG: hypothetical protein QXF56_00965 [Candidatus Micrarchaeia archaeon]
MEEKSEVFEDEFRVKGDINFELNLQLQINRINQLLANQNPINNELFIKSVLALSEMLSAYHDEKFKTEYKEITKECKKPDFWFSLKLYGALCRLMDRLNLLLEKSKKGRFER